MPVAATVRELDLRLPAGQALRECERRGLVVRWRGVLAGHPGGVQWRLGLPGRTGTLELNESAGRTWLRVSPSRASAWVTRVAEELARL